MTCIQFPKGNIEAAFEKISRFLEREGVTCNVYQAFDVIAGWKHSQKYILEKTFFSGEGSHDITRSNSEKLLHPLPEEAIEL